MAAYGSDTDDSEGSLAEDQRRASMQRAGRAATYLLSEDTDEDDPAERPVNRNWSNLSLTARGGYDRSSSARKQAHADQARTLGSPPPSYNPSKTRLSPVFSSSLEMAAI